MSRYFKLCHHREGINFRKKAWEPGAVIKVPECGLPEELVDEHIKAGLLEEMDPSSIDGMSEPNLSQAEREAAATAPSDENPPGRGRWRYDPAELQQFNLAQLNAAIHGVDPTVEPFETKEEAIAFMSADYGR